MSENDDDNEAAAAALARSRREVTKKPPAKRAFHSITAPPGHYMCDIVFPKYAQDSRDMIKANNGMTQMLILIEIATRFAYVKPIKSKASNDVCQAFRTMYLHIIEEEARPFFSLTHDAGVEFDNAQWKHMIQHELPHILQGTDSLDRPAEITLPTIRELVKEPGDRFSMGILDRFCRTLKTWIEDYMIENATLSWVDALPHVMKRFNEHDIHFTSRNKVGARKPSVREDVETPIGTLAIPEARTTLYSPIEMREAFDEQVRSQRFDPIANAAHRADVSRNSAGFIAFAKIKVGDKVRIRLKPRDQPRDKSALTRGPGIVEKGSDRWSNKVYTVTAIEGYSFSLVDSQGRAANRTYRAHELFVVPQDSVDVPDILAKPASQARRARRAKRS